MPEAPDDRAVLAEKSVDGLVHSGVILGNRYVAPCSARIGQQEIRPEYCDYIHLIQPAAFFDKHLTGQQRCGRNYFREIRAWKNFVSA